MKFLIILVGKMVNMFNINRLYKKFKFLIFILTVGTGLTLWAGNLNYMAQNTPEGIWKTIDDESGEAKSHVEIYKSGNEYQGKIIKLLPAALVKTCDNCPGELKGKPLVGLVILKGLETYKDYWKNGTILDPKNGNHYGCSIWFEGGEYNQLKVRGKHWSGLYRDQTWYRVK